MVDACIPSHDRASAWRSGTNWLSRQNLSNAPKVDVRRATPPVAPQHASHSITATTATTEMMATPGSSKTTSINATNFDAYNAQVQGLALEATKFAAGLPLDIAFHRTVDSEFAKSLDACSEKALRLTNRLLALASNESSTRVGKGKGKARLEEEDDVTDKYGSIVIDVVDQLFERVVRVSALTW